MRPGIGYSSISGRSSRSGRAGNVQRHVRRHGADCATVLVPSGGGPESVLVGGEFGVDRRRCVGQLVNRQQ